MSALIDPERLSWLESVQLTYGEHSSPEEGLCAVEAAAYVAGEAHSDHPQCVCPVIAEFMRSWNDLLGSDEERTRLLRPLIPLVVGTRDAALAERRSLMALDWLVREHLATWLGIVPALSEHAEAVRALAPIDSLSAAHAAGPVVRAAWVAAGPAASAAAAGDAAAAAGAAAAGDAAMAAAVAAAGDAAGDAAVAALAPTTALLQASASELVERMCALGGAS